jgi:acetylornithine aminotransferase
VQHLSNYYHSRPQLQLAQQLVASTRAFQRVFFCNSGTEANEAALKFARKYALIEAMRASGGEGAAGALPAAFTGFSCKDPAAAAFCATRGGQCDCWPQAASTGSPLSKALRTEFVAFTNGFHGRSMGALATTHKPAIRQPFSAFPADVKFARFNNAAGALRMKGL